MLHWPRRWIRVATVSPEARWIWVAIATFIAMSVWWLAQDKRVPDWDTGLHESLARVLYLEVAQGRPTLPFTDFNSYPPLVHLIGAISIYVANFHPMAIILSSNLVFVPLLAFGCFGVGRIAYGPRAGVLAAVLALGSPMFVSMMHQYELDPAQAAMVAVSLWALLASHRFERIGTAAVAGVLAGLAMMTKETSIVFLAGPVLVIVLRGGWRNPLGLLVFLLGLGGVAGPWYLYHWHDLHSLAGGFVAPPTGRNTAYSPVAQPPRFALRNFTWYAWDLVNVQLLAPFALLFVIGVVLAVVRMIRRGIAANSVEPELLVGLLVSYAGMTYIAYKDSRYTLPMLVYVAVLATGWIGQLTRARWRRTLALAVVALAGIYFVGVSTGIGQDLRIKLPGHVTSGLEGQLTFYEKEGYLRGAPENDGDVPQLMDGLVRAGIRAVGFVTGSEPIDFNYLGLSELAYAHGLKLDFESIPPSEAAYMILAAPDVTQPAPCTRLNDGSGIFIVRVPFPGLDYGSMRDPSHPNRRYTFICPGKRSVSAP